jgi:integrase
VMRFFVPDPESSVISSRCVPRKGGTALTVILRDHVVTALHALPSRPDVHSDYFFWSGQAKYKSLTVSGNGKLHRLNDHLSLVDYENKPIKFHSHQLRDTFAVTHLLNGTSMEDFSQMLSHISVKITEKYYSPRVVHRDGHAIRALSHVVELDGRKVRLSLSGNIDEHFKSFKRCETLISHSVRCCCSHPSPGGTSLAIARWNPSVA